MKKGWIQGPLFGLALCALWFACGGESARPKRVVLITLDTLRYDSFAPPASGEVLMPALRKLAGEGASFDNFYANTSTTQPSHASLFTGLYPWGHGVTRNGQVLNPALPSFVASLQSAGFWTHAIVSSFPLHAQFGFEHGFDRFEDEFDVPYVRQWEGRSVEEGRFFSLGKHVTERAIAALDAAPDGDQFFWFHYFDPHDPYGDTAGSPMGVSSLLSAAKLGSSAEEMDALLGRARKLYALDVRNLDRALATLIERIDQDRDRFETHLVVTADHGESFGEKGAIGHGKRVTREQVHVPLVLRSPLFAAGERSDAASLVDLPRTLLALAGVPSEAFGGRDLGLGPAPRERVVLGMRRSFSKPKREWTTAGESIALSAYWFFQVRGTQLVSGNRGQVLLEGDRGQELAGEEGEDMREFFRTLELLVSEGPEALELQDATVQKALSALGYLDSEESE